MASHAGISCDSCSKSGFPGRRYKCLICDNYDLCGPCFDSNAESHNHKKTHPMQCILTEMTAEIFYQGDSMARQFAVSLTCPYCGQSGFIPQTLLSHCVEKHSPLTKTNQFVICPICASSSVKRGRIRFPSLATHLATDHEECGDCGLMMDDDMSLLINSNRQNPTEGDSDQEADEEIEEPWGRTSEAVGRFGDESHQDETNLRFPDSTENTTTDNSDHWNAENHSLWTSNTGNRQLVRQNAIRLSRGGAAYRGQSNSSSNRWGTRAYPSSSSTAASRHGSGTTGNRLSQNITISNPMSITTTQDPLLEYINQILQAQYESISSSTNSSNNQNSQDQLPNNRPSAANNLNTPTDVLRAQQRIEHRMSASRLRTVIMKSKRPSQATNQSGPPVPTIIREWRIHQQPSSTGQTRTNNVTTINLPHGVDIPSDWANYPFTFQRNSQERESLSLLARMLRQDFDVNNDEIDEARLAHLQNHALFLRSLLLSTMTSSIDEDDNQTRL